jgi:DNA-binding NtrC family response regulator
VISVDFYTGACEGKVILPGITRLIAQKGDRAMRWLRGETPDSSFDRLRSAFQTSSLKTRLMVGLIPPVVVIMMITGYVTYYISKQSISTAVERTTRLQTVAVGNEIEVLLERCRQDLANLAQEAVTPGLLQRFLARHQVSGGIEYTEAAFIAQKSADHLFYMANDGHIAQIPDPLITAIKPSPLIYYNEVSKLSSGQVWLSPIIEVESPLPDPQNPNQKLVRKVLRMVTPCCGEAPPSGYLMVSIDARNLRNILSLYNSSRSPIWAYQRTAEERYMYFFDTDGWILFQSETVDKPALELTTHLARAGYTGTLGRQGLESAFRPDSIYATFWKMVDDVREGHQEVTSVTAYQPDAYGRSYFLAYAPVRFKSAPDVPPQVVAGVAYLDISRLTLVAGYKHVDIMFYITLATALIVGTLIYVLGRIITRPILKLADAVNEMPQQGRLEPIELPYFGREITALQRAINGLIATLQRQMEEIRQKDRTIRTASLKEQALLAPTPMNPSPGPEDPVPSIVGCGPRVDRLKSEIVKAAQVDADVLIMGETGTGKQLAAEAIHRLSSRSAEPFISINCGALDENLLLDTLFGHVRGAFTEAKADRKGAFLEADRGTLFLDEIQVASPRVQQAMLRAIAMRQIKPLGSDREVPVDVRLIVATNADLRGLIQKGAFREDLYFRLKVITLHTIPLREQRENVVVLARHFLKAQETLTGRVGMGLSKGALSKLERYDWAGNVRELQNCLTRAAVMAEHPVIQAEDIPVDVDGWEPECPPPPAAGPLQAARPELNRRQQKAFPLILARGRITRSDYQEIVGDNLPVRTAIYDLQDLVKKGVLKKTGSGPATCYVVDSRLTG